MGIASPETDRDRAMKAAFDAGWDGAFEEAILIIETAEHKGETLNDAIAALRKARNETKEPL